MSALIVELLVSAVQLFNVQKILRGGEDEHKDPGSALSLHGFLIRSPLQNNQL